MAFIVQNFISKIWTINVVEARGFVCYLGIGQSNYWRSSSSSVPIWSKVPPLKILPASIEPITIKPLALIPLTLEPVPLEPIAFESISIKAVVPLKPIPFVALSFESLSVRKSFSFGHPTAVKPTSVAIAVPFAIYASHGTHEWWRLRTISVAIPVAIAHKRPAA
jgi:hypothetical protein